MCRPGDVIVLQGRLGSGKTAFCGGLAEGLAIDEIVTSPSFVLVRRYDSGFLPLVHVDVYRLGSLAEFDDLDLMEDADEAVVVIEWGDAVAGHLPDDRLRVVLEVDESGSRDLVFDPQGHWRSRALEGLAS